MPTKSASKQLTISIVSYNTKDLLKRCLSSVYKFTKNIAFEVIVVDNASTDGSVLMVAQDFPRVKLIKNTANQFYTGANNQALAISQGEYFLILNSDIFLKENVLPKMIHYLKAHSQVGAIEPAQLYEDGRIVATGSRHDSLWHSLTELTLLRKVFQPKSLARYRMVQKDRLRVWPAEVICDAALMCRASQLIKLGGYDSRFKLYFTENDLCRRFQALGLKTIHYGLVRVWHTVSASTNKAGWQTISPLYNHDAFTYYRKYHSLIAALIIYLAMALNNWRIFLILALALTLRLIYLPQNMIFNHFLGEDYLAARDMVLTGNWPLLGITTTLPWLRQGPYFVWLIALAFKLGNFHPAAPAALTVILGTLTVYLFYRYSRSLIGTLFFATSPLAVMHSRLPYHISPIPFLTIIYLIYLRRRSVFWTFFLAGMLLQFELSTLPVLLFSLIYLWPQRRYFLTQAWAYFLPLIPRIIYDFQHHWQQTYDFVFWVGFRVLATFGFNNWRSLTWNSVTHVTQVLVEYWVKFLSWGHPGLALLLTVGLLFSAFRHKHWLFFILLNVAGFYFNGYVTESYLPILFPIWTILIIAYPPKWWQWFLGFACLINIVTLVSHQFYFKDYGPSLSAQIEAVKLNSAAVDKQNYNYQYLLWYVQNQL